MMTKNNTHRVLCVDDDPCIRDSVQNILKLSGYATNVAENGAEALHVMKQRIPDIIVSDIVMPVMDGFAFCDAVRENSTWSAIPFIFMRSRGEKRDVHRGHQSCTDFYVTKPIDPDDLLVAIQSRLKSMVEIQDSIQKDIEGTR